MLLFHYLAKHHSLYGLCSGTADRSFALPTSGGSDWLNMFVIWSYLGDAIMMVEYLLRGANIMSDLCIALYFLRFWQEKGDKLFLFFSCAFFLMAVSNLTVAFVGRAAEFAPFAYGLRLAAFSLIIFAIFYKNRPGKVD